MMGADLPRDIAGPVLLELRCLRAEVAALREDQQHLMRSLLARDDRRAGQVLLPLVAELVGGHLFTGPSLLAAALADRTAAGQAAREVIADMATDAGGLRAFGRLLSRLDGVPLAGCRLQAAGEASDGRRWRLLSVSDR